MRKNLRAGFTLIELMVAMALTLFIMVILSQAFQLALETFAGMKGIADMQGNLRTATILLRDDLSQDHFEGKLRVSDLTATGPRPQAGFFAVMQRSPLGSANYVAEDLITGNLPSYRATDHILYMTSKRKGNRQANFYTSTLTGTGLILNTPGNPFPTPNGFFGQETAYNVPIATLPDVTLANPPYTNVNLNATTTGFYNSQWAEIVYYLKQTGTTEELNNPTGNFGTPTYGLYRAQFGMVPDATHLMNPIPKFPAATLPTFIQLSCNASGANVEFYSPADAALGTGKRVIPSLAAFDPINLGSPTSGRVIQPLSPGLTETLVLPNVISFHVQIMPTDWKHGVAYNQGTLVSNGRTYISVAPVPAQPNVQPGVTNGWQGSWAVWSQTGFGDVPANVYDTTQSGINNFGLKAIQVTLRVFDASGTRQTRQVTIVQDL